MIRLAGPDVAPPQRKVDARKGCQIISIQDVTPMGIRRAGRGARAAGHAPVSRAVVGWSAGNRRDEQIQQPRTRELKAKLAEFADVVRVMRSNIDALGTDRADVLFGIVDGVVVIEPKRSGARPAMNQT